tara:strand:+ start:187 stop:744 length:558 start_codon:yes stop_codon:yes gene_type:complete
MTEVDSSDSELEDREEIDDIIRNVNKIFTYMNDTTNNLEESDDEKNDDEESNNCNPKEAIQHLFGYMNSDNIDLCMSRNGDDDYEEIKKDTTSIYFGSCCVCQLSFNVKLEKGRKYKHKGYVNLFTLDKKTDEEIEMFDIDQKKRIMYMKYPIKREYELTEYKIKPNHIQNVLELDIEFNYFQYI